MARAVRRGVCAATAARARLVIKAWSTRSAVARVAFSPISPIRHIGGACDCRAGRRISMPYLQTISVCRGLCTWCRSQSRRAVERRQPVPGVGEQLDRVLDALPQQRPGIGVARKARVEPLGECQPRSRVQCIEDGRSAGRVVMGQTAGSPGSARAGRGRTSNGTEHAPGGDPLQRAVRGFDRRHSRRWSQTLLRLRVASVRFPTRRSRRGYPPSDVTQSTISSAPLGAMASARPAIGCWIPVNGSLSPSATRRALGVR